MEQKKSTLKEIKATVMPQTAEGLQMLMEETGLTIGEVIDRLTLQMCPDDLGFAVCFAQDQVFFSISSLPEEEQEEALTKIIHGAAHPFLALLRIIEDGQGQGAQAFGIQLPQLGKLAVRHQRGGQAQLAATLG